MFKKQKSILTRLNEQKRVDLTPRNYSSKIKQLFTALLIITLCINALLILSVGVTILSLVFCLINLGVCSLFIRSLYKTIRSTSIKGGTIILNTIDHKSTVTSLRSVGSIKSKQFLGMEWTTFKYKLDGQKIYVGILNRSVDLPFNTGTLINKAIVLNKKEKANHKPGSVATN